jgi:hypothetical protein
MHDVAHLQVQANRRRDEKGENRIGGSRLQHISQILQVPVPFFFEGAPAASGGRQAAKGAADAPSPSYVTDFLATSDGLSLAKAIICCRPRQTFAGWMSTSL